MKSAISCRFDPKTRGQSIVIFSDDWGVKSPPKRIICAFRYHAHKVGGNTCSVPLWFSGLCLTCWVRSRKKSLNLFMSVQTYSRENPISKQWMKFHGIEVAYIANWGWLYITYTPPIKGTRNSWNTVEYFQPLTQTYPIISPMVPVFICWGLISDIPLKSSRAKTPKTRLVGWRSFLFGCFCTVSVGTKPVEIYETSWDLWNQLRSMKPVEIYETSWDLWSSSARMRVCHTWILCGYKAISKFHQRLSYFYTYSFHLVGVCNPFEKHYSTWESSPKKGMNPKTHVWNHHLPSSKQT